MAYQEMCDLFEKAGLGVPPIPHRFRDDLFEVARWAYSTQPVNPLGMYMFAPETEVTGDYVAVCHAGHGVNSYAITYHLVSGPLVLFAQTGWGGVYMDAEEAASGVRAMFAACARLAGAAERRGRATRRLVVAESIFRGPGQHRWLDPDEPPGARWDPRDDLHVPDGPFGLLEAAVTLLSDA